MDGTIGVVKAKTRETCSLDWTGVESKSGWEEVRDDVLKVSP